MIKYPIRFFIGATFSSDAKSAHFADRAVAEVTILPDRPTLLAVLRDKYNIVRKGKRQPEAICISQDFLLGKGAKKRIAGRMARLLFHENRLGAGVVSHEIMHAVIGFAKIARYRGCFDRATRSNRKARGELRAPVSEERLCSLVEHLNKSFWEKYNRIHAKAKQ